MGFHEDGDEMFAFGVREMSACFRGGRCQSGPQVLVNGFFKRGRHGEKRNAVDHVTAAMFEDPRVELEIPQ
jgi:hypothetical protein